MAAPPQSASLWGRYGTASSGRSLDADCAWLEYGKTAAANTAAAVRTTRRNRLLQCAVASVRDRNDQDHEQQHDDDRRGRYDDGRSPAREIVLGLPRLRSEIAKVVSLEGRDGGRGRAHREAGLRRDGPDLVALQQRQDGLAIRLVLAHAIRHGLGERRLADGV